MPVVYSNDPESITVPPGFMLAVIADDTGTGVVRRTGNSGENLAGYNVTSFGNSDVLMFGPFSRARTYSIEVATGSVSYVCEIARDENIQRRSNAERLRRIMQDARANNPYKRPVFGAGVTLTVSATSDAALTNSLPYVTSNALNSFAKNNVAWYGGIPSVILSLYVAMPVTSVAPSTNGNIGNGFNDKSSWAFAQEVMTDAPTIQFTAFSDTAKKVMFQVDDQYIDFNGLAGVANGADNFWKLVFSDGKPVHKIRVMYPTNPATGSVLPKGIRVAPGYSVWKPTQDDVIRAGCIGDSFFQGTNQAGTIYPIPNAALPVLMCELNGFRDCRQLAVGGTGYLATGAGASKARDQIARWTDQLPFDVFIVAPGYNDQPPTFGASAITNEVYNYITALRAIAPLTPIIVWGCQASNGGPTPNTLLCERAIFAGVDKYLAENPEMTIQKVPVSTDPAGSWQTAANSSLYVDSADLVHPSLFGANGLAHRGAAANQAAVDRMCAVR